MTHWNIDKHHDDLDIYNPKVGQALVYDIWNMKYRAEGDETPDDTFHRVSHGLFGHDDDADEVKATELMQKNLFVPGGRILAANRCR